MFSSAEMQLIYNVANAPIQMFPYPHIVVRDVFPADFYRRMRENLPPRDAYKTLKELGRVQGKDTDTRTVFPLVRDAVAALPEPCRSFWHETAEWLLGGSFGKIVLQKFAPLLAQRFPNPQAVPFDQEVLVIQDSTNYSLGPHTDVPQKVLSFLFYLPADDSHSHLGTSMYLPRDPAFTCPGGPHHGFEKFIRLLTVPYVPNTLFAFMKGPNSFHGVEPILEPGIERALMLYDIYVEEAAVAPVTPAAMARTQFSF